MKYLLLFAVFFSAVHCSAAEKIVSDVLFRVLEQFFLELQMSFHVFAECVFELFERDFP